MNDIDEVFQKLSLKHDDSKTTLEEAVKILNRIEVAQSNLNDSLDKVESAQSKLDDTLNKINNIKSKGAVCSINGNAYEHIVHKVVKFCNIVDEPFNVQNENDLAGSSSKNDLTCQYKSKDFGIEVKKAKTPDWMQCSIKFCKDSKQWKASKGKIPSQCQNMFNDLINSLNLYDGDVPPFMEHPLTHDEWKNIKSVSDKWNDVYLDIPSDTIQKLYAAKGCHYIQISDNYGLYHLGQDFCSFGVPLFEIEQRIRIRTKIHSRSNKLNYCSLSVTVACQPCNIKDLNPSPYSLDDINKLPLNLDYLSQNDNL